MPITLPGALQEMKEKPTGALSAAAPVAQGALENYSAWRLGPAQMGALDVPVVQPALEMPPIPPGVQLNDKDPYWVKTWPGAKDVKINVVDKLAAQYGHGVQGWTSCDKDAGTCDIIINRNADRDCVEKHERHHASGWDHPEYPKGFICPETGWKP
jgi:hypothetical protein